MRIMKKVLIVDDSMSVRESFLDILSPLATCQVAANGQEAINLIKLTQGIGDDFDIVIMDIIMPEKDGLTAVKEIRDYESLMGWSGHDALTILITTTLKDPSRVKVAQESCGADDYIAKPFTRETLLKALKKYGLSTHKKSSFTTEENRKWGYAS